MYIIRWVTGKEFNDAVNKCTIFDSSEWEKEDIAEWIEDDADYDSIEVAIDIENEILSLDQEEIECNTSFIKELFVNLNMDTNVLYVITPDNNGYGKPSDRVWIFCPWNEFLSD